MEIKAPYNVFLDSLGKPVTGSIWIGTENANAEVFPQQVYLDEKHTLPIAQPISLSSGYPVLRGTPINIYTEHNYSLTVRTLGGVFVYSKLSNSTESAKILSVFDYLTADQIAAVKSRDTSLDLTSALQTAIDASCHLYFPPGLYNATTLVLHSNLVLEGAGRYCSTIRQIGLLSGLDSTLYANSGSSSTYVENIDIRNLGVIGPDATPTFSEHQHLISFHGVRNARVTGCLISGFKGDGIYNGSDPSGSAIERHNKDIWISDCIFDGVNKENRNAVTVIDGERIFIQHNTFMNCTKSNMPGAVDIEPDSNAYHLVKSIDVSHNSFKNVGGNVGVISLVLNQTEFTTQPEQFTFSNNVFSDIAGRGISIVMGRYDYSADDLDYKIQISGNVGVCDQCLETGGLVAGLTITNNQMTTVRPMYLGYTYHSGDVPFSDEVRKLTIFGNSFRRTDESKGEILLIMNGSDIDISHNTFANYTGAAITVGWGGATADVARTHSIKRMWITDNVGIPGNNTALLVDSRRSSVTYPEVNGTHVVEGSSCVYLNNGQSKHFFPAFINDNAGLVINTTGDITNQIANPSFCGKTLPDSFPLGISVALMNGNNTHTETEMGLPMSYQYQGTLTTHRTYLETGYEKYTYQTYHWVPNGPTNSPFGTYFIRNRATDSNVWASWYKHSGTEVTLGS